MPHVRLLARWSLFLAVSCAVPLAARAQSYVTGLSYFDEDKAVEFIPGDMPLVITVPHGGTMQMWGVPDRVQGCAGSKRIVTSADSNTVELARKIQQTFFETYGARPYIVIAHIARRKIDLNRDLQEAACGHPGMEKIWKNWHDFAHAAVTMASEKFGGALYIDLHGHGHPRQRLELGYLLNARKLQTHYGRVVPSEVRRAQDAAADEDDEAVQSGSEGAHSLTNLPALKSGQKKLAQLLFGDDAFGTLITLEGLNAVPGKQDIYPEQGQEFFNGGYNTARYTGRRYPAVFGWQIEVHRDARYPAAQADTARVITQSLFKFMARNTSLNWKAQDTAAK